MRVTIVADGIAGETATEACGNLSIMLLDDPSAFVDTIKYVHFEREDND